MCQACVDEGFLKQEILDKLDAFADKWPGAAFGPAHIVIDDANVENHSIDWCVGLIEAVLAKDETRFSALFPGQTTAFYEDDDPEELAATLAFLKELREIPEDAR